MLADARPAVDELERAVARSRAASALFGHGAGQPRIGRHVILERAGAGGMGVVWEAYDPELDRAVAIKLVRADTTRARERVLAEGQALARLSHPNVVPVFDVGLYEDQVYLVMELIRGHTLRAHVAEHPRDARAIAQIYRQAGEGLAAAHRAGLIHRDFKPDNAIVGRDGRVRILDFGLAHTVDPAVGEAGTEPAAAGTPRYMAPEQAAGGAITAAADQYAFCVSLREALTGPAAESGPRPAALPRWLEAIVARGTQVDPAARFPSMDEVTRALGRDPRVVLRNRLLVIGAAALAGGAFAIGRAASEPEDALAACDGGRAAIESVWGAGQRTALVDRLAAERDPYARESAPRIAGQLDHYRDRWAAGHRDACVAHRRGEQSAALLDRRMACLARGKAALTATVDVLAAAPASALPGALIALGELPDLDRCGDPSAMLAAVAPPPAAVAGQVAAVDADLERALVLLRADRSAEARDLAVASVATARRLEHPPVLARALLVLGRVEMDSPPRTGALAPLGEATTLALEVADDALAVEAFARRAWVDGTSEDSPDFARALDGRSVIEALSTRLGPAAGFARALFHNNMGGVEQARGRPDRARSELERALVEARRVTGAGAIEMAKVPSHLALVTDDPRRRAALFAESIRKLTAELGADHPMTLSVRAMAGTLTADPREAARQLEPTCRAYARFHPTRGSSASGCWFEAGWLAQERAQDAEVEQAMSEVVATAEHGGDPVWIGLARAYLALARGDPSEAAAGFVAVRREIGPLAGKPWWTGWYAAEAELGDGLARRSVAPRAAEAAFDRARAGLEVVLESQPAVFIERRLARARLELIRLRVARRAPAREVAPLARAAAAWYRAAGGYEAALAELSPLAAGSP